MRFSVVPMVLLLVVVEYGSAQTQTCKLSPDYCSLCENNIACPVSTTRQVRIAGVVYFYEFKFYEIFRRQIRRAIVLPKSR